MADGDKIQLQSKEGDLFGISSDAARFSKFLATTQDDGMDGETIPLSNVTKDTLAKVVTYMEYHVVNPPAEIHHPINLNDQRSTLADSNVCEWDCEFLKVEQDVLSELILAAHYLDIKPLLDLTCTQLTKLLMDRDGVVRKSAAGVLSNLGEHAAPAVTALTRCLEHRLLDLRQRAAEVLGKLGEHAAPAVPALTKYLEHRDGSVRRSAAEALGKLGEHAAPAVPALIKYLEHRDHFVRWPAAEALGKLGEHAAPAVPALTKYQVKRSTSI